MKISKCSIPINVQFEVTYNCNNSCIFCYNPSNKKYKELNTQEAIQVIDDLASCGVLSVNFNGGEPLLRKDFFEIAATAKDKGLDIHMNTNATLVNGKNVQQIADLFPAICTTILSGEAKVHNSMSGSSNAFMNAIHGIELLQNRSVYVAVNIMLSKRNLPNIGTTYELLRNLEIKSVLITRYIPCVGQDLDLIISDEEYLAAIEKLYIFNNKNCCFDRIALPQPFQVCHAEENQKEMIAEGNIACNVGLCTATIRPNGDVTPCNLVSVPILGNVRENSFCNIWKQFNGESLFCFEHLKKECINCEYLPRCGGGCKGYNDSIGGC